MSKSNRPAIWARGGALSQIVDEAEQALLEHGSPIYQRSGQLVRPIRLDKPETAGGIRREAGALLLHGVEKHWLTERMARAARWEKFNTKGESYDVDPAIKYAETLLARVGEWQFPPIRAVLSAPTMTMAGRLIQSPGYDSTTGLLLDFDEGAFPPIPDKPSRDDAAAALDKLAYPFRAYDFASEAAKSVALSAMLTATVRANMRTCPMHAADASDAGSGKTKLLECAGVMATGSAPAAMNQGKSPEEDEKRLSAALMAADPAILIDNCDRWVQGDFLCSMLTSEQVQPRILGHSQVPKLDSTALVLASGNNLTFAGDMHRRAVVCRIEPDCERPDQRVFGFDPVVEVTANRGELVAAALTVLRAYICAGRPATLKAFGSFADYDLIRGALVWLGWADPAETREVLFKDDPKRNELSEIMAAWEAAFGDSEIAVSEISDVDDTDANRPRRELIKKLTETACRGGWNGKSVAGWLRRHKGRILDGRAFYVDDDGNRHRRWKLHGAKPIVDHADNWF